MCFSKPKIEKADPVAPPPPPRDNPTAPVLNEATRISQSETNRVGRARRGRSSVTIPLISTERTGVNIPQ